MVVLRVLTLPSDQGNIWWPEPIEALTIPNLMDQVRAIFLKVYRGVSLKKPSEKRMYREIRRETVSWVLCLKLKKTLMR